MDRVSLFGGSKHANQAGQFTRAGRSMTHVQHGDSEAYND